jgi:hypothetical protein
VLVVVQYHDDCIYPLKPLYYMREHFLDTGSVTAVWFPYWPPAPLPRLNELPDDSEFETQRYFTTVNSIQHPALGQLSPPFTVACCRDVRHQATL